MKKLEDLIKSLIEEGKSNDEIIASVLDHEENKNLNADELIKMIGKAQKAENVAAGLRAIKKEQQDVEQEKTAKKDEDARVEKAVEDVLKKMSVSPFEGRYTKPKELKIFCQKTGKIVGINREISESYAAFNALLICVSEGNKASAAAISRDIEIDNSAYLKEFNAEQAKILNKHGYKAANDPSVSDVDVRGGHTIPTEVNMIIQQLIYAESVMMSLMNTDNIVFQDKIYPIMFGMSVDDIANQTAEIIESQAQFSNPTVNMERAGVFSHISNTLMRQKGADIANAFTTAFASEFAVFMDIRLAIGNFSSQSQPVDGIVFDDNTFKPAAIALASLDVDALAFIKRKLDIKAGNDISYVANRLVTDKIGLLENGVGHREFPQYVNGGTLAPLGVPHKTNAQITSVLDIGGDSALGGTDDVLLLFSKKHAIAGISGDTRIDTSVDFRFTNDVTTFRGIKSYGAKVLMGSGDAGVVAIAQELTNV